MGGNRESRPGATGRRKNARAGHGLPLYVRASVARATGENLTSTADAAVADASTPLPYADRIQAAFGQHDVSKARATVGGAAAGATLVLDARAFTLGDRVGFAREPDLRLAAHEAAHVVQQQHGVQLAPNGAASGDRYERQAERAADAVAEGRSAEAILEPLGPGSATRALQRAPQDPSAGASRVPDSIIVDWGERFEISFATRTTSYGDLKLQLKFRYLGYQKPEQPPDPIKYWELDPIKPTQLDVLANRPFNAEIIAFTDHTFSIDVYGDETVIYDIVHDFRQASSPGATDHRVEFYRNTEPEGFFTLSFSNPQHAVVGEGGRGILESNVVTPVKPEEPEIWPSGRRSPRRWISRPSIHSPSWRWSAHQ